MGNKLSCSCAPLIRKAYRYEDSPWQTSRRRDGHLLRYRLWAEVFHVSSGTGTIKWQQVSEDLVPVNITCIQDSPECVFHITAYNSQVDKILDVRLVQPGTRIGQASECFVYWKDPTTSDTWGLNFTSPIDAKQFKECCSPSFKFSRKASSSYSLKLDPPSRQKIKTKRKPQSTPASPSRSREPQCTCMTAEQYARLRAQDPRYRSSTLPRATTKATETDSSLRNDKITTATSSTSLYDNVSGSKVQQTRSTSAADAGTVRTTRGAQQQTDSGTMTTTGMKQTTVQNHVESQAGQGQSSDEKTEPTVEKCKSEGTQAGGTLSQMSSQTMHKNLTNKNRDHHRMLTSTQSMDYDVDGIRGSQQRNTNLNNNSNLNCLANNQNNNVVINYRRSKSMSKSTDDMREGHREMSLDSNTLKRMLKPMMSNESPQTSPEMTRRRYTSSSYYNNHHTGHYGHHQFREQQANNRNVMSDVEGTPRGHHKQTNADRERSSRFSGSRSSHEIGRSYRDRGLCLEFERNGIPPPDMSPPSDNVLFDNQCYATTPCSSNGNSDLEQPTINYRANHHAPSAPASPTSRLLLEYEMHLRNTLAKGMDAESYSLHTFEALLSQSMENLEFAESIPTSRSPYLPRRRTSSSAAAKSSTLPLSHRLSFERPNSVARDREGYYSDRNELMRERERERGYLSDHNMSSRCASCLGESTRAHWFRHSDGWRSGSSAFGSSTGSGALSRQSSFSNHKRSPWDSLPSLRHDSSRDDITYKGVRADSFDQRSSIFDRQDSFRSDYMSNRDIRYGLVQQASVESADSRLCYLTSSEVSHKQILNLYHKDGTSRRSHKTVHFGDSNERIGCCTAETLQNCCQLSTFCRELDGSSMPTNCRICSKGVLNGWSSLETIPVPYSKEMRRQEDENSGCLNPCGEMRKAQLNRGSQNKFANCLTTDFVNMRPGEGIAKRAKSLPNELESEADAKQLFSFIDSVLSSWFVEDGAYTSSQGDSERDEMNKSFEGGSESRVRRGSQENEFLEIKREKYERTERRKQKKEHGNDCKEISLTFDFGKTEEDTEAGAGKLGRGEPGKQRFKKKKKFIKIQQNGQNGLMTSKIRELVLTTNRIPDGALRFRHNHRVTTVERCNFNFLQKMSDEDRMSLTTAVSDEEDGESVPVFPYRIKHTGESGASFNCTGAVRKAGFLSVKKWLLRKKHQIELARKRGWKGYWVCLKGTTLLFYPCESREGKSVEAAPKHLIIVDGAIMQPIPEHPKRDYIFCLSTAFGDAYLFQAPCQVELENWVHSIHCACAAAFARHRGKTGTLHLLQEEIFSLEKTIESDRKLKHMADLQQSVVSDPDMKQQLHSQIIEWEETLEKLHCEQFRLRCYMASLHNGELPNPKSLLTHVSRITKNTLNKLGVFTVSSFHAFICARSPSLLNNLLAGRGANKRRPPMLSRSNSGSSRKSLQMNSKEESERSVRVSVPDNQTAHIYIRDSMSVEEFLASACSKRSLNAMEHFVRVKKRRDMEDHNYFVPHRTDLIETYLQTHEIVEVCAKILYQVELQRTTLEQMWGFSVEAELNENAEKQDELCCYVSRVEDKSVAMHNGIIKGDEIMVINGAIVSDLDMMYLESVLQEELALCMMMRSSRTEPPDLTDFQDLDVSPGIMRSTDDIIESLVCPPPPSDPPVISEEMISGLIVPAPAWNEPEASIGLSSENHRSTSRTNSFEIENLLKTAEQVTGFCRSPQETRKSSPTGSITSNQNVCTPGRQLTHAEKLRKVILELVDTERAYVEHLNNLLENYLKPLKRETFLSNAEINALFGNIQEIVAFQRLFLRNLEESIELEPDFHKFEHPSQFKNVLFSIGSAFLYYVNHFKLYSSFCASHSKAQKVLHPNEGNQALQAFLAARNPRQQHSSTLESYLIKPIQRILKYPLLLQQLKNLTDPQSNQHQHLIEALKGMEKVAEHINEMQRIHEEYGAIFDHLFRQHQKSCKQPIDLSPGDLLYYGGVEWLNISDFLGKIKKGLELHAMCFVFKSAVVFLCKERLRQKKKLMGVSSKGTSNEVEIIRYQVLIPVTEVQVRASSAKDMDSHFLWELIHLKSQVHRRSEKVYVLSNSTADFRNAFLKTIRQIIRESVRNMSIPATKPMQSGSNDIGIPNLPPRDFSTSSKGSTSGSQSESTSQRQVQPQTQSHSQSQAQAQSTLISQSSVKPKIKPKPPIRHSTTNLESTSHKLNTQGDEQVTSSLRTRTKSGTENDEGHAQADKNKSEPDPGTKSDDEEDSQSGIMPGKKTLGKTPNHLTLSSTSTLSTTSVGSQARLIQSSQQPEKFQPQVTDLGSPVWKPRSSSGFKEATTLPRHKAKTNAAAADAGSDRHSVPQGHGTTTRPGRGRKSIADVMMHENK